MTVPRNTTPGTSPGFARLLVRPSTNGCPPRGWASILQKRSVTRTDRFQNQMVVTGDSFHGVRLLSAKSARVIGVTALPRLYRPLSGFLTVSAVFSHPSLVALFHATSAHRILVFRAFPSSPAVISLDIRCSLVVSPAPRCVERTLHSSLPLLPVTRLSSLQRGTVSSSCRAPPDGIELHPPRPRNSRCTTSYGERSEQPGGLTRAIPPMGSSPPRGELQRHRASVGVDFRALIRRGVRSRSRVLPLDQADALLTFPPSEVCQLVRWALALPSSASNEDSRTFRCRLPHRGGPGYRSDRAWKELRRAPPTPCGFLTSLPTESHSPPVTSRTLFAPAVLAHDMVRSDLVMPPCRSLTVKQVTQPS
jgi:hypothetical protein